MSDESRRTLRDLARRAEWRGRPGAAGAAADARSLRELGAEIENVLASDPESQPDDTTWARQAAASLAAYCQRAQPNWTPEQIAELSRLREDATIALAPGPGELDSDPDPKAARNPLSSIPVLASLGTRLGSRRPAVIALAVVSCLVLIALVLTLPHFLSNDSAQTPTASSSTTFPLTTTQPASPPATTPGSTATPTSAAPSTTPTSSTSSASSTASTSGAASSSHVTAIQIAPEPQQGYPEVIVSGTITASGTGDITVNITVTGSSGEPQVTPIDDSGQTSYNLTQTIYLNQWCGQSSVRLTVSSGTVSQSATVPVSGC